MGDGFLLIKIFSGWECSAVSARLRVPLPFLPCRERKYVPTLNCQFGILNSLQNTELSVMHSKDWEGSCLEAWRKGRQVLTSAYGSINESCCLLTMPRIFSFPQVPLPSTIFKTPRLSVFWWSFLFFLVNWGTYVFANFTFENQTAFVKEGFSCCFDFHSSVCTLTEARSCGEMRVQEQVLVCVSLWERGCISRCIATGTNISWCLNLKTLF